MSDLEPHRLDLVLATLPGLQEMSGMACGWACHQPQGEVWYFIPMSASTVLGIYVFGVVIFPRCAIEAAKDLEALSSKLQKPQMDRGSRAGRPSEEYASIWIRSEVQVLGPRVSAVRGCHAFSIPKQSFLPQRFAAAYTCFEVERIVPHCEAVVWYLFCQDSVGSYKGFAGLFCGNPIFCNDSLKKRFRCRAAGNQMKPEPGSPPLLAQSQARL